MFIHPLLRLVGSIVLVVLAMTISYYEVGPLSQTDNFKHSRCMKRLTPEQ
jgi:hypothetical protein